MTKSTSRRLRTTVIVFALSFGMASTALRAVDASIDSYDPALTNVTFVFFDTETTGFSPVNDRIVEIGAVKFRGSEIIEVKNWLINPQRDIPARSQGVHGITNEDVKDKPTFAQVYPEFQAFIGDAIVVAHNARFDLRMVRGEATRNNLPVPTNAVLDSLKLFRTLYPDAPSHKLSVITKYLGVSGEGFHRAAADTMYTVMAFQKAVQTHPDIDLFSELVTAAGGELAF